MYSMAFRRVSMGFLQVVRAIYFYLIGFSEVEVGILISFATLVSAIHHLTFGWLSDKYGRKPFFIIGSFFATLRMVIFAISTNFWVLAIGQGVGAMGEGAGAGQPVVSGYISDKTDIVKRPSVFSTLAVSNALAATLGSLLAGLPKLFETRLGLDMIASHQLLFWIGALSGVISLILNLPMEEVWSRNPENDLSEKKVARSYSWDVIIKFSLVRSTSGLGWSFIQSMLSLYFFLKFGTGGEVLGPIYATARFISVFSYMLVPVIVERMGDIPAIIASRFITAILALAFAFVPWYNVAIILMVSFRIAIMFTMPIRQTFATSIVDPEETATAIGISNFSRMSLRVVAPTLVGYLFEAVSLSLPFVIGSGLLIANGLLYRSFFGTKMKTNPIEA
jgi:MFS family permease